MRVLRVFFLGFVYGWWMKWIIDQIYTKDNLRMITNENAQLRDRIKTLEAPQSLEPLSVQRSEPTFTPPTPTPRPQPVRTPSPSTTRSTSRKDDLKLIKGIGPQLEKKLNSAGITTFNQMARLTTTELQSILGISKRVVQSADNLISQAKKFARENARR